MNILGINALFHDPAAALVVDGEVVCAAEEERFSRRKHGHRPVPFAAWELPELAAQWCLERAGLRPEDIDLVGYSFDPQLAAPADELGLHDPWDHLRQTYARRAPDFLATALRGLDPANVRFVPHHVAHAASAGLASPYADDSDVLVLDGRGESTSHLAGRYTDGMLDVLAMQRLPHSLGLLYEDATEHLGFLRSSDEYKVMALASHGTPRYLDELRQSVYTTGDGGFRTEQVDFQSLVKRRQADEDWTADHANFASSLQHRLEEVLLELSEWLHAQTGSRTLTLAGGVALNCVANTRLFSAGPYQDVWVQPAAGDAGTALGAALHLAREHDRPTTALSGVDLGRSWSDEALEQVLEDAAISYTRPSDIAQTVAECLAGNGIVAWFQGGSEFGPRALGHRSLLAHPGHEHNLTRLNNVKGREQFRPVAPMVRAERAGQIFSTGPQSSPYMLFVHDVADEWRNRIPAAVHVDGTARIQTVHAEREPLLSRMLELFEQRTGLPVVINTSLNTAGRPMVDSPRDALECFGSAPIDLLAIGPFAVTRARSTR